MSKGIDEKEIDKDVSTRNFFDLLGKYGIEECKPYIKSLSDKRNYMLLSYELFNNSKDKLAKEIQKTSDKKTEEMNSTGMYSFGSVDTKQWNTIVDGYEVGFSDMLKKTAWDFFHYAKLTIDMYLQIINAALLGNKHSEDSVQFSILKNDLIPFDNMNSFLKQIEENSEYKYIKAFDNYMKHINEVPVNVEITNKGLLELDTMSLKGVYIHSFSYKGENFETVDASYKMRAIRDYVVRTTSDYLRILLAEKVEKKGDF